MESGKRRGSWIRILAIGSALLSLSYGCSEQKNPIGFDKGPRGSATPAPGSFLAYDSADVEFRPNRSTGNALSILVGKSTPAPVQAESRGLILFGSLPDTTSMRHAYLRLHILRGAGDPIGFEVRRVLGGSTVWTSADSLRWWNQPAVSDTVLGAWHDVSTGAASLTGPFLLDDVEIPIDLVRKWVEEPTTNAGLELLWTGGDGIARIISHNDAILDTTTLIRTSPLLILATDTTKTVTRTVISTADAYVIDNLAPAVSGDAPVVRIGAGPASRLLVRFDLSVIPRDASVVRATLRLPLPAGQVSSKQPLRFLAYQLSGTWSETPPPDTTAILVVTTLVPYSDFSSPESTDVQIEMGAIAQRWINGTANDGLSVRLSDETFAPLGIQFYTREDPDPSHHPTLNVFYVRPPAARLEEGAR